MPLLGRRLTSLVVSCLWSTQMRACLCQKHVLQLGCEAHKLLVMRPHALPPQPAGVVAFVGRDHVWPKTGMAAGARAGLARALSMCQWTLVPLRHEVVVIPDALLDGRCEPLHWLPGSR